MLRIRMKALLLALLQAITLVFADSAEQISVTTPLPPLQSQIPAPPTEPPRSLRLLPLLPSNSDANNPGNTFQGSTLANVIFDQNAVSPTMVSASPELPPAQTDVVTITPTSDQQPTTTSVMSVSTAPLQLPQTTDSSQATFGFAAPYTPPQLPDEPAVIKPGVSIGIQPEDFGSAKQPQASQSILSPTEVVLPAIPISSTPPQPLQPVEVVLPAIPISIPQEQPTEAAPVNSFSGAVVGEAPFPIQSELQPIMLPALKENVSVPIRLPPQSVLSSPTLNVYRGKIRPETPMEPVSALPYQNQPPPLPAFQASSLKPAVPEMVPLPPPLPSSPIRPAALPARQQLPKPPPKPIKSRPEKPIEPVKVPTAVASASAAPTPIPVPKFTNYALTATPWAIQPQSIQVGPLFFAQTIRIGKEHTGGRTLLDANNQPGRIGVCGAPLGEAYVSIGAKYWKDAKQPQLDAICVIGDLCVKLTNPKTNTEVVVPVRDRCPACGLYQFETPAQVYANLAGPKGGTSTKIYNVKWMFLRCSETTTFSTPAPQAAPMNIFVPTKASARPAVAGINQQLLSPTKPLLAVPTSTNPVLSKAPVQQNPVLEGRAAGGG